MELANTMAETESSRNFYMGLAQERLAKLNEQALLIDKLRNTLDAQEEELAVLKRRSE